MSVSMLVRDAVNSRPADSFVRSRDLVTLTSSRSAIDTALHRVAKEGDIQFIRNGIYYKGKRTRFGMTRPDPMRVGFEIADLHGMSGGVGPSGYSAARALGLTTQMPSRHELSVPGRAPGDTEHLHFVSRPPHTRSGLRPLEVAILEVLREWPRYSEADWTSLVRAVCKLESAGDVRLAKVVEVTEVERHLHAREQARRLADQVNLRAASV